MSNSTRSPPRLEQEGDEQRNTSSVKRLVLGILDAVEELLSEDMLKSSTTTCADTFDTSHQDRADDEYHTDHSCSLSREPPRRELDGQHRQSRTSSLMSLYKAAQVVSAAQSERRVCTRKL
jgi:hypothetical protein